MDRYRRALSLLVAGGVWALLAHQLGVMFGAPGPTVLSVIVGLKFAALAWWLVEAMFAWAIAMWEVEHDHLARDRTLPTATLLRRR